MTRTSVPVRALLTTVIAILTQAVPARADYALRRQVNDLAKEIKKVVQQQKQEAVMVGEFTGPANLKTSAGPAIQRLLIEELSKVEVKVRGQASLEVKGDYGKVKNSKDNQFEFKLNVSILDDNRDTLASFPGKFVSSEETLVKLLGGTGHASENAGPHGRNQQASDSIDNPQVFVSGAKIQASDDSPYAMEIMAGKKNRALAPRQVRTRNGLAFVEFDVNEVYEVRLHNRSKDEVAVALSIDGLDVFTFAEEKNPKTGGPFQYYFVKPNSTTTIHGWFRRLTESRRFEVADYGQGEASRLLGTSAKIGTITATFRSTYESVPLGNAFNSPGPLETKQGDKVETRTEAVIRNYGPMHTWISARYVRPEK